MTFIHTAVVLPAKLKVGSHVKRVLVQADWRNLNNWLSHGESWLEMKSRLGLTPCCIVQCVCIVQLLYLPVGKCTLWIGLWSWRDWTTTVSARPRAELWSKKRVCRSKLLYLLLQHWICIIDLLVPDVCAGCANPRLPHPIHEAGLRGAHPVSFSLLLWQ